MEKKEEKARTLISRTGISSNFYLATKGFTLIEIIVVIFILSISLAIVFPSINTKRSLNSEAKRLASILRYLLDNAITKKETFTLTVKFPERVLIYETSEGKREERFPDLENVQTSKDTIRENSSITIFFYPTGVKDLFTFVLKNEKEEYLVKINPVSYRVKIERRSKAEVSIDNRVTEQRNSSLKSVAFFSVSCPLKSLFWRGVTKSEKAKGLYIN